jgi:predicted N-acyltransferase
MASRRVAIKSPFHDLKWLKSVEKIYSLKMMSFKAGNSEIPFFLIDKMGKRLVSLPYCDYGGPAQDVGTLDFTMIDKAARDLDVDCVEIRNPGERMEKVLSQNGFAAGKEFDMFEINLKTTKERLWKSLNKKIRNGLRKAKREGLNVNIIDDMPSFYRLYAKSRKRLGTPHHPMEFFEETLKNCEHKMLFAELNGKKIAVSIFLLHNKRIYYWVNASDPKHVSMNPNDLIIHETAMWGIENRFESLELGVSRPMEGTHLFKKKWATASHRVGYYYRFYRKGGIQDKESAKYRLLRIGWRYSPMFVTNFLGPRIRKYFP